MSRAALAWNRAARPAEKEGKMISYDELCQALDRYSSRLKNEAEMSQLEQDSSYEQPPAVADEGLQAAATAMNLPAEDPVSFTQTAAGGAALPGMEPENVDQALELRDAAVEQPTQEGAPQEQQVSSEDQLAASELAQERPEDTHEIDVDDVVVEDK